MFLPGNHADRGQRVEGPEPEEELTRTRDLRRGHPLAHLVLHLDLPLEGDAVHLEHEVLLLLEVRLHRLAQYASHLELRLSESKD